ncbi:MAG: hypothetical protein RLZZ627_1260 [Pseudomonadota bacterium]|jgi:hypothetical protein
MHDLVRHEVGHGISNLIFGAVSVQIRHSACGTFIETVPEWPEDILTDRDRMLQCLCSGLLAGRLHVDNVDASGDEALLAFFPQALIDSAWEDVERFVKPELERVTRAQIEAMVDTLAKGQPVILKRARAH